MEFVSRFSGSPTEAASCLVPAGPASPRRHPGGPAAGVPAPGDLRALRAFREDYPEAETALLHRGPDRLRIGGVWCVPVGEFLRRMRPDRDLLAWLREDG